MLREIASVVEHESVPPSSSVVTVADPKLVWGLGAAAAMVGAAMSELASNARQNAAASAWRVTLPDFGRRRLRRFRGNARIPCRETDHGVSGNQLLHVTRIGLSGPIFGYSLVMSMGMTPRESAFAERRPPWSPAQAVRSTCCIAPGWPS